MSATRKSLGVLDAFVERGFSPELKAFFTEKRKAYRASKKRRRKTKSPSLGARIGILVYKGACGKAVGT